MQELYTLISNAPAFIQVLFMVLCLIGLVVAYRFKYIVGLLIASGIALYMSIRKGRKDV